MPEELPSRHFDGIEYYNIGNAAKYIGISKTGLHYMLKRLKGTEDEIKVHEQAGRSREHYIKKSDLDRYMRPRPVRAKEAAMMAPEKAPTTYSVPTLKERGWTEALIKKFLGNPDVLKTNPRYKSAAPMRLYTIDRVEECEAGQQWQDAASRAQSRSKVGKAVAQRRAAELLKAVETLPITVQRLPLDELQEEAIESYNNFHSILLIERGHDYDPASKESDPAFLERITVNYIRHHLTEYDDHLEEVAGKVGISQAIDAIRDRVYDEIAKQYPEYAQECKRQIRYRKGLESEQQHG